jgi:hypothetical protein
MKLKKKELLTKCSFWIIWMQKDFHSFKQQLSSKENLNGLFKYTQDSTSRAVCWASVTNSFLILLLEAEVVEVVWCQLWIAMDTLVNREAELAEVPWQPDMGGRAQGAQSSSQPPAEVIFTGFKDLPACGLKLKSKFMCSWWNLLSEGCLGWPYSTGRSEL